MPCMKLLFERERRDVLLSVSLSHKGLPPLMNIATRQEDFLSRHLLFIVLLYTRS